MLFTEKLSEACNASVRLWPCVTTCSVLVALATDVRRVAEMLVMPRKVGWNETIGPSNCPD